MKKHILSTGKKNECVIKNKNMLVISIFIFMIFTSNCFVYGQYTGNLPAMTTPIADNYTHDQTQIGQYFLMNYNGTTPADRSSYSFLFGSNYEILRVCQNGTLALMGSTLGTGKYPALNFYTKDREYRASINCENNNLNLIATNQLKLKVNKSQEVASLSTDKISVFQNLEMTKNNIVVRWGLDNNNALGWIGTTSADGCIFGAGGHANMFMDNAYHVFIGPTANEATAIRPELRNKYRLFVYGGVLSEDLAIAPKSSWSDFVFDKDYKLCPLTELEQFIKVNKHLPDVPSAKEVAEDGYSQHNVNKVLLQKIEELTLYVIEQQKRIEELESAPK